MKHIGLADGGGLGDGAHGDRIEPVLGKQRFRGRENPGNRAAA